MARPDPGYPSNRGRRVPYLSRGFLSPPERCALGRRACLDCPFGCGPRYSRIERHLQTAYLAFLIAVWFVAVAILAAGGSFVQ